MTRPATPADNPAADRRSPHVPASHIEAIRAMEPFVDGELHWLKSVDQSWQPSDLLPDTAGRDWHDAVNALRTNAGQLSDEVLVVLIGDTVTEEALPSYQTMINRHVGLGDVTGASDTPWAKWTRGWTAEELRHGDLLTRYLYLTGRVNMRAVEVTTQHLVRNGFDTKTASDPYKGLIYTSFQERATRVSHGNVARLANQSGDQLLGKMCALVASDESRHEEAYKRFVGKLLELDPSGTVIAFAQMMKARITMPARLMSDGGAYDLFARFSAVAQRIGVYTAQDYIDILEHLIAYWKIPALAGLAGEAASAQDYLCALGATYRRWADRSSGSAGDAPVAWSWIFQRTA